LEAIRVRYAILGPLEVRVGGRLIGLGGPQQRTVLALLLLGADRVVSTDRIIECLWVEPPQAARNLVQGCVFNLRRALRVEEDGAVRQPLITRPSGYQLEVRPDELDRDRFEAIAQAAAEKLRDGGPGALLHGRELLRQALAEWRGPALDDIAADMCRAEAVRLDERRLAVFEEYIDVGLLLGAHADMVAELRVQIAQNPLRERLYAQLMLALRAADRQAEALAVFRELRTKLVEQLGIEPSPTLKQIEHALLSGADAFEVYRRGTTEPGRTGGDPARPGAGAGVGAARTAAGAARPDPGRPAAPSGPPARPVPAQLPAAITGFTGRANHLLRLDGLVVDPSDAGATIATITGPPGVGKSALAVHWAHRVRDRFPDGSLFIDLRGYPAGRAVQPIDAVTAALYALGVPAPEVPTDLDLASARYRTELAGRRVLVLLDNARSPEQIRPLLPGEAGCLVLVTSRDRLSGLIARDGAQRVNLDLFAPDEAELLVERLIGGERAEADPGSVAELARLCGYLPLALRITAANLLDHPDRDVAGHVAQLAAGNRLTGLAVDGDEHTAVRAAFAQSYTDLDPTAQRLFRLLGLCPGADIAAPAAAALAGLDPDATDRALRRLASAHLISQPAPGRYTLHDLLRLYAAERAHDDDPDDERTTAIERLLDWYLRGVDAAARMLYPAVLRLPLPADTCAAMAFGDRAEALAFLDAERTNLRSTIQYAAEHGPHPAAWLLADALRGFLWLRRHLTDWLTIGQHGLAAAQAAGDRAAQAACHISIAVAEQCRDQHPTAVGHYVRAVELSRQIGWLEGESTAAGNLALTYVQWGRPRDALPYAAQALELARRSGRLASQMGNLGSLACIHHELGNLELAVDHGQQALALTRELGSPASEAIVLGNLAEAHHALGRHGTALHHASRALAVNREIGDRGNEPEALRILAAIHRDTGRLHIAVDHARDALTLAVDNGYRRFEAAARTTLATVHQRLGHYQRAVDEHQLALRVARHTDNRFAAVSALIGLADAYRRLGDPQRSVTCAERAIADAEETGQRVLQGAGHTALAAAHLALGRPGTAAEHAILALDIQQETGHRLGQVAALDVLADAARDTDPEAAARYRERSAEVLAATDPASA
jgi:DNA-binding SARP family transcriptional activator/tetratricopeptide (TPR) repeat protein